ncbi:ubiquitin carboxyl-terminal hydrolase 47 [Notolabrus celidotus]|uniref:ubiquitin carboxyl-terminal hydrolase 47 n=1 Tax=Notolabrus celidotus TaxID=1203425 RepID=UPI0014902514|nr:ubiquitin carboxyl-terminal hydrolase 47 [Notolabrus celidotus]
MSYRKRVCEDVEAAGKRHKGNRDVGTPLMGHHYGLKNQGATCYLNSMLQILFMTPEIHDRLDPKATVIDQELRTLFVKLKKTTCGTENITKSLEITNVRQQRDAAQCLEKILHKVSSNVSQVFKGQQKYTTTCSKGHIIIEEINPFLILPLSLEDANDTSYSVENGFGKILLEKTDNEVYCNKCEEKTEATSECQMLEFPHILILLLKRFDLDYSTMKYFKSDCCVEVPRTLQRKNKAYELYGIVNHMGGLTGGHYTATIRSREDETWYEFDDSQVRKVDEEPFSNAGTYNSRTAYLLLYRDNESSARVLNKPAVIALVCGCVLISILIIVLPTVL